MPRLIPATVLALVAALSARADDYALTVYSTAGPGAVPPELYRPVPGRPAPDAGVDLPGYAVVRQDRAVSLPAGLSEQQFTDVAALIDPTTVTFRSLTHPDSTHVVEQNYRFDLVSTDKLLERYLGHDIIATQHHGDRVERTAGTLLGTAGGLILERADGSVVTLRDYGNVNFQELPGGLITRPTLVWLVDAARGGEHETRVTYQTGGMTWWADYNAVLDESGGCRLDLSSWVTLINRSGAGYEGARLKLVAGDVHRAEARAPSRGEVYRLTESAMADRGFEERAFFEYHLYTLKRPTDLPDNATKQIELFEPVQGVACTRELVYEPFQARVRYGGSPNTAGDFGRDAGTDVNVYLRFTNDEDSGLGIPLPAGRVRVNQRDPADGSLEFIGEDAVDHTPRDEEVLIRMGNAFDVVGERTQTAFQVDKAASEMRESFRVELRNHKDEPVRVIVREHLHRWSNWQIQRASHEWEKQDAGTIHFPVDVPARENTVIEYTVHYAW